MYILVEHHYILNTIFRPKSGPTSYRILTDDLSQACLSLVASSPPCFLLVAEAFINPYGWSLFGLLLYGFIVGKHPCDQAWGSL